MEELFEMGAGFWEELLQPYLSHTRWRLQDLERALGQADWASAALIAHTVKGSSLNIGFVGMGSRAGAVELGAKQGKVEDPKALAGALDDEFRSVALFAERYRPSTTRG